MAMLERICMCQFCDELKELKMMHKRDSVKGVGTYYRVALVVQDFKNHRKCGQLTCRPKKFKYCPECGREIK